jgi:ABC-type antimicrobial peptide transport system permease subunit
MNMLIKLSIKNIISRQRASIVSILGVMVSVALIISITLVLQAAQKSFARPFEDSGADMIIQLQGEPCVWSIVKLPQNLNPIPIEKIDEIQSLDEVVTVEGSLITWAFSAPPPFQPQQIKSPSDVQKLEDIMTGISTGELEGQPCDYGPEGSFCDIDTKTGQPSVVNFHPIVVTGINPELKNIGPIKESDLNNLEGRFFTKEDNYVAILDKDFARIRNVSVGNNIELGQTDLKVIGIMNSGREAKIAGAQAFVPLKTAIEMIGRGNIVDIIFVKLKTGVDLNTLAKKIEKILGTTNVTITTSNDYLSTISILSSLSQRFSLAVFIIVVFLALVFIIKTTAASVYERTGEIGILKGIGWQDKNILKILIFENFFIALLGGIFGIIVGYGISYIYKANLTSILPYYLNPYPPCSQHLAKSSIQMSIPFSFNIMLATLFLAIVIKTMAGYITTKIMLRLQPAEAIRRF